MPITPTINANHNVAILTIKVALTAISLLIPFWVNKNVKDPSVTPNPAGNIETEPTNTEKRYVKNDQKIWKSILNWLKIK